MKKLILLFIATVFGVNVFAQEPVITDKEQAATQVQKAEHQTVKDGIIFKSGKAWKVKNAKSSMLDNEITVGNGIKVKPDGSVQMKDGASTMLREGDFISMDGMIERVIPVKAAGKAKDYPAREAGK